MNEGQAVAEEVPPGYKRTEAGVVPEEWTVKRIGDLIAEKGGSSKTGPFGTLLKASEYSTEGVPIVSVSEIGFGKLEIKENTPMAPPDVVRRLPEYCLKPGDIVFGRKGAVERSAIIETHQEGWFLGSDGIRLRLPPSVHPPFIAHQLQSLRICKWLISNSVGTTMASLNQDVLSQVVLSFPPLPEQRAIAAALSDAGELIGALDALIEKKRAIKQAAMQQLLTGKKRLPGFEGEWEPNHLKNTQGNAITTATDSKSLSRKQMEMQEIPDGWKLERIVDIAPLQRGFDLPISQIQPGPHPIVYSNGILQYHVRAMVKGPGVVTGRSGTIGKVHFVGKDFWPHNTALWVTSFRENDPKYIYYLYIYIDFSQFLSGSGVSTLNRNDVHQHKICIPSPLEQRAIATVLSDMDAGITALKRRRDKAEQIKQGMMQELLTGRTRLIDPPEAPA